MPACRDGGGGEAAEGEAVAAGKPTGKRASSAGASVCVLGVLRRAVKHAEGRRRGLAGRRRYYLLAREGSARKVRD